MLRKQFLTASRMQSLDRWAIQDMGIPAVCLMENAGRGVAQEAFSLLRRTKGTRVCVVCGPGNNGGDGLVAARHLAGQGVRVSVVLASDDARFREEAMINYRVVCRMGLPVSRMDKSGLGYIDRADVIVDALFGTGLSRPVMDPMRALIVKINEARGRVISVDIPSGLDATTGKVWGVCVQADVTVALAFPKRGFVLAEGPRVIGRVVVVDIGIPPRRGKG